jgi:hypothetical protein
MNRVKSSSRRKAVKIVRKMNNLVLPYRLSPSDSAERYLFNGPATKFGPSDSSEHTKDEHTMLSPHSTHLGLVSEFPDTIDERRLMHHSQEMDAMTRDDILSFSRHPRLRESKSSEAMHRILDRRTQMI